MPTETTKVEEFQSGYFQNMGDFKAFNTYLQNQQIQ